MASDKMTGRYYTPPYMARRLVEMLDFQAGMTVLEPGCGDGVFIHAVLSECETVAITGVDIDRKAIDAARRLFSGPSRLFSGASDTNLIAGDFTEIWADLGQYDLVIGNPPFIKYQSIKRRDYVANQTERVGIKLSKLANMWAVFVVLSIAKLKTGGTLAMVLPSEFLQVKYAGAIRDVLITDFERVDISLVEGGNSFDDAQQGVILLVAKGYRKGRASVGVWVDGQYRAVGVGEKWSPVRLTSTEYEAMRAALGSDGVLTLGDIARVNVGVLTGNNEFFVPGPDIVAEFGLEPYTIPVVTDLSAPDLGLSLMLNTGGIEDVSELGPYIKRGIEMGVHEGYKCRIRDRWFDVPNSGIPDAFITRQVDTCLKLVPNLPRATSTNRYNHVHLTAKVDVEELSAGFCNPLLMLRAELLGRAYGGGVLELTPRELEMLPVTPGRTLREVVNSEVMEVVERAATRLAQQRRGKTD